jgi:SHOCT-like protein
MSEERKKVLEMLAAGKITADEAERLLDKLASGASNQSGTSETPPASGSPGPAKPKYLRIVVDSPGCDQVNMRVPLAFVGTGSKLLAVMPHRVSERLAEFGIDAGVISAVNCDDFGQALRDINIDVERGNGKKVRIYCE